MKRGLEGLLNYIEDNRVITRPYSDDSKSRHELIRMRIRDRPDLIGIAHDELTVYDEVRFPKVSDIIFVDGSKIYFIEVKSSRKGVNSNGTIPKLAETYKFIKSEFGIKPEIIIVYGRKRDKLGYTSLKFNKEGKLISNVMVYKRNSQDNKGYREYNLTY